MCISVYVQVNESVSVGEIEKKWCLHKSWSAQQIEAKKPRNICEVDTLEKRNQSQPW